MHAIKYCQSNNFDKERLLAIKYCQTIAKPNAIKYCQSNNFDKERLLNPNAIKYCQSNNFDKEQLLNPNAIKYCQNDLEVSDKNTPEDKILSEDDSFDDTSSNNANTQNFLLIARNGNSGKENHTFSSSINHTPCYAEYYWYNRFSLFRALPQKDLIQAQSVFYEYFLQKSFPDLLQFYFPAQFKDYNNKVSLEILNSS
ncbi:32707_t:CDS:2 [Gigaspora margarita]|uniref:32707_t:CDS:1 n=1 Tax=Gigaspora margarita TaxID=4874 RepID=A0ABN7UIK4_GIGMA|nr:32707_t:CDS:2 [Gigaspora margarita]